MQNDFESTSTGAAPRRALNLPSTRDDVTAPHPIGTHRAAPEKGSASASSHKGPAGSPSHRKPTHRAAKIAAGATAGVLALAWAAGAVWFSGHLYPNTTIAGSDVSLMTADEAAGAIEASLSSYSLTVTGDGLDYTFTPAQDSFSVDATEAASSVLNASSSLTWPLALAAHLTGDDGAADGAGIGVTYDKDALAKDLSAAIDEVNQGKTGTFDAAGAFDPETGTFTVEKARSNQKLNGDAIVAAAEHAVETLSAELVLDDSSYDELAGGATDEQLQAACDAANQIIDVNVTLTMGGTEVATLDGSQMMQWVTFDENLSPKLDDTALTDWIAELAKTKLDTAGTERTYTRADGKQVTVSGGVWGWISDEAALAEQLQQAVAENKSGTIEIPVKQKADTYAGMGQRDWGAYVDVDLTEQYVRFYDENDNVIWESHCISGNPNKGNETPTGIYKLNSNNGAATLVGKKDPETGEPEYRTPVSYWMPFVGGSVGLHDADWQSAASFADPTAYQRVGSHGCINLPTDKAGELSKLITVGTCVITHY